MALELTPARPEHISELGRICYEAFKDISDKHHFPSDFPSVAMGRMISACSPRARTSTASPR